MGLNLQTFCSPVWLQLYKYIGQESQASEWVGDHDAFSLDVQLHVETIRTQLYHLNSLPCYSPAHSMLLVSFVASLLLLLVAMDNFPDMRLNLSLKKRKDFFRVPKA